jgi:hypothetical protein
VLFLANGFGATVGRSENKATSVVSGVFGMAFVVREKPSPSGPLKLSPFGPPRSPPCCLLHAQSRCSAEDPISDTPPALCSTRRETACGPVEGRRWR